MFVVATRPQTSACTAKLNGRRDNYQRNVSPDYLILLSGGSDPGSKSRILGISHSCTPLSLFCKRYPRPKSNDAVTVAQVHLANLSTMPLPARGRHISSHNSKTTVHMLYATLDNYYQTRVLLLCLSCMLWRVAGCFALQRPKTILVHWRRCIKLTPSKQSYPWSLLNMVGIVFVPIGLLMCDLPLPVCVRNLMLDRGFFNMHPPH